MARLTRDQAREVTREKLLEAAREVVIAKGYDGTSVADIAEAAGFTKGAFFSNFASKEEIFLEVLKRHKRDEFGHFADLVRAVKAGEKPVSAIDDYIAGLDQAQDLALLDIQLRLHAARSATFAEAFAAFDAQTRATLGSIIVDIHVLSGKPVPDNAEELADLFLSLIHGLALHGDKKIGARVKQVMDALMA
jgi:AcrR family transcriptional regulator